MKQAIKCFVAALAAMCFVVSAYAQMTTSSLGGLITDSEGIALPGVAVVATHQPSGTVYGVVTNSEGRYAIQGMRNGGPYKVEVSCLGYRTVTFTDVTLQLAEQYKLNAFLKEDKEMLSEAVVVSTANSKFSDEKTGAATNISSTQMESLPTISRSITDVAKLSPYGGDGMNFAGGDGRSANFTVDGANFNNNFGLSSKLPGGGSPISLDAIDEVQVVVSPYDVRQTNFIGGGVNAITKSGTNQFKGSAYIYHRNENMRGSINSGNQTGNPGPVEKERTTTYGATLGGPIVKNKLFFFVNFEYVQSPQIANRWHASEDGVAIPEQFISRTTIDDMNTVKAHLKDNYNYDAGSISSFPANESNMKVLARIDWNITDKHHLALRYNYAQNTSWNAPNKSSSNCGLRTSQPRMSEYSMAFANSMYSMDNNVHSLTLDLNSRFSNDLSNQLLFTFSKLDDIRGSNSKKFPFIDILDGTGVTPYMSVGYELFTWNNGVHNNVITLKDDITYYVGNHKVTAGLNYEYQMADNAYMRNGTGYYRYNSLDDFLNQRAPETVAITYGYDGEENPAARVRFHQAGIYAQDEWTPTENFKLTYGLRIDGMFFDNRDLMTNAAIKELDFGGRHIDTGKWPNANVSFSPRIGFSWDILGNKSLKLRGGTGLFSGRLPLVFFTNMPSNSGMVQNVVSLTTTYGAKGVVDPLLEHFAGPIITDTQALVEKLNSLDPKKFPTTISPKDGVLPKQIQAVDPKFKMPQVWKTSIALDYAFPTKFPFSITGEFIYNKTVNGVNMANWNQKPVEGFVRLNGPDNRPIFPDAAHAKYTSTDAFVLTNTNRGYGYTANVTLKMEPIKRLNLMASYTYTAQKELTGMPGSNAESAFTYTPTVYGPNNAPLHSSQYVTPHRVFASLSYTDKAYNHFSLFYEANPAGRYSYMYDGDINGDGYDFDSIYIPTMQQIENNEFRFNTPDDKDRYIAYAKNSKYLTKNAGKYAEGYSVFAPWLHRLDFRYAHDFRIPAGKQMNTIQLSVDFKNILNFFNSNWGVAKYMEPGLKGGRILSMDHIDAEGYPVFTTNPSVKPDMKVWVNNPSPMQCWYIQVGIKYMFN